MARAVAGAGLVGMVVVITMQVLYRYFLDQSLAWTEEVSRFLFILTSFIAITVAHRRQMHAGYSSLVTKFPVAVRRVVIIGVDVVSIVFFVVVGLSSRNLIDIGFDSAAPATGMPMAWIYLVFPIFAVLGVVFSVEHIVLHLSADAEGLLSADEDRAVAAEAEGAIADTPNHERSAS
ncbi:TRAP transporter small permease [Mycolicibacterium wolinskyi]|uniref:TRAP transporter small permease n=1 Tax=Mycolicibacterium wolinskyi TaxID=59750 RepID=UPI0039176F23